ncbi:hypothetical protein [Parahaliea mediterranea]|uniref:Uncharacterized protein n=1 Tax=Parahaliea mediterranea TaxID=651086 RepID=A0A939ILH7_9GAMM|nr:hypothetical protein [Parahaliea mediterranea]MBN7795977.1 hypothetical protein [Parahaliea mediterranea]
MITAPVDERRLDALRELLAGMNRAPGLADPRNTLVPFYQFGTLHVARLVIIEALTNDDIRAHGEEPRPWPPTLAFLGDVDGDGEWFLAELAVRAGEGLTRIFDHCVDFSAGHSDLLAWMRDHNRRPAANYVNWRGRTLRQVREEAALVERLRAHLRSPELVAMRGHPLAQHAALKARVDIAVAEGKLRLSEPEPTPAPWWLANILHLLAWPLVLLLLSPLLVLAAPVYLWRLRRLERADPENRERPGRAHLARLAEQEDLDVSNQFNVFGQVKPGRFRRLTIRVLLGLLDYSARHVYRRGYLTRVQTIHFARWVLLDGGRRVYFASNYDGSADSYMDDFINKVAWGLNLVFGNGVGYPRCRWLVLGGAKHEQKYKYTLRRNQLPSQCWYKAYPGLTAVDLARNAQVRAGLALRRPTRAAASRWLELL